MTRSPEPEAAIREVARLAEVLLKARARVSRCRLPSSLETARRESIEAELAYRIASDERDRLVDIERARAMQTGDPLAVHHNRSHDGPALSFETLTRKR